MHHVSVRRLAWITTGLEASVGVVYSGIRKHMLLTPMLWGVVAWCRSLPNPLQLLQQSGTASSDAQSSKTLLTFSAVIFVHSNLRKQRQFTHGEKTYNNL